MSARPAEPMVLRMTNPIQHYDWGSPSAFADRFGWGADGRPQAEVWMGAHPKAPSSVRPSRDPDQDPVPLDRLFAERPELLGLDGGVEGGSEGASKGAEAGSGAGAAELPFLLKVLAAARPLSIQTHPTAARAAVGFAAEEAAGIPLDAPQRMYRDRHHKPELLLALEDFTALSGFRPVRRSAADLAAAAELLDRRGAGDEAGDLRRLAETLTGTSDAEAGPALESALETVLHDHHGRFAAVSAALGRVIRTIDVDGEHPDGRFSEGAADTVRRAAAAFPGDPGLIVALLLHRITLKPGEALYLPAGNLHAYLHGLGVEVMASSDNVLRGGLTSKHVDVAELVDVTECSVLPVPRCTPVSVEGGAVSRWSYRPECPEFRLDRIESAPESGGTTSLTADRAAVLLCTAGSVELVPEETQPSGADAVTLTAGESALLTAGSVGVTAHWAPGTQAFLAESGGR